MIAALADQQSTRYARCIQLSKKVRWEIDDVIAGRVLDVSQAFMPDGLSLVRDLAFLDAGERRFLSQVQGRTYAYLFGLVERFVNAKVLEISRDHWFGDQVALEALVRFSDEELKHQALFRRMEELAESVMPAGYTGTGDANRLAAFVMSKSTWAVLALTCHMEIATLVHYRKSIEPAEGLSALWKDVFLQHGREEAQHALLDELEWRREDGKLDHDERDAAVTDLVELVVGVDAMICRQAEADAAYFRANLDRALPAADARSVGAALVRAYRWQYIASGMLDGRFTGILTDLVSPAQAERITSALRPLLSAAAPPQFAAGRRSAISKTTGTRSASGTGSVPVRPSVKSA